jgi:hypothetical protein
MSNVPDAGMKQRHFLTDERRKLHLTLPGHGADLDGAIVFANEAKFGQVIEIYDRRGCRKAEIHHWNEALPARQKPRLTIITTKQFKGGFDRCWAMILEPRRLH